MTAVTHVKAERVPVPDREFLIPGEGELDDARYLPAMEAAGYCCDIVVEISLMVQRRPGFDPIAAAEQSYRVPAAACQPAGIGRPARQFR